MQIPELSTSSPEFKNCLMRTPLFLLKVKLELSDACKYLEKKKEKNRLVCKFYIDEFCV
jgi:hypothetical protein